MQGRGNKCNPFQVRKDGRGQNGALSSLPLNVNACTVDSEQVRGD